MGASRQDSEPHGANAQQFRLARSLVEALGLDGAIFACRANGWDGVLECLLAPRSTDNRNPAGGQRKRV